MDGPSRIPSDLVANTDSAAQGSPLEGCRARLKHIVGWNLYIKYTDESKLCLR